MPAQENSRPSACSLASAGRARRIKLGYEVCGGVRFAGHLFSSPAMASSSRPSVPARLRYPQASQPEVIRAHQKDVYYCDQFREQLSDVASDIIGSRRSHKYRELLSLLASVAYFGLSTLGSSQSLGEEYVNAMMRRRSTGRIVGVKVRGNVLRKFVNACAATRGLHRVLCDRALCALASVRAPSHVRCSQGRGARAAGAAPAGSPTCAPRAWRTCATHGAGHVPVSYTHLTLPTILLV